MDSFEAQLSEGVKKYVILDKKTELSLVSSGPMHQANVPPMSSVLFFFYF